MIDCNTGQSGAKLEGVIPADEREVRSHVDEVVRQSVEETLNGLLEAEAEQLCRAKRYERSAEPDSLAARRPKLLGGTAWLGTFILHSATLVDLPISIDTPPTDRNEQE